MNHDIKGLLERLNPYHYIENIRIVRKINEGVKTFYFVSFYGRGKSQPSLDGKTDGMHLNKIGGILLQFDNDLIDSSMRSASL